MKTVLFLCSGNYYRSRLAEVLFEREAQRRGLGWRAISRGFRLSANNVGPISPHALEALAERNIETPAVERGPQVVTRADLEQADLIVAVKESEHRPKALAAFPDWAERIEYWAIDDIDCAEPAQAVPLLEAEVLRLVERLAG